MLKFPSRTIHHLFLAGVALTAISCGAGGDGRQQALDALDRTTAAADLESQMAGLVESTGLVMTSAQGRKLGREIDRIDGEAEVVLTSSSSGASYDENIDTAVNQTREAGSQLAVAVDDPAQLVSARKKASARLVESNRNLKQATTGIGEDLADDDGNLSEEDAAALGETAAAVDESGQVVAEAAESAACTVPGRDGGAFAVKVVSGDIDCGEAARILEVSSSDETMQKAYEMGLGGSSGAAQVGDWFCLSPTAATITTAGLGAVTRYCEREADGARIEMRLPK